MRRSPSVVIETVKDKLIKHHTVKTFKEVEVPTQAFLISALGRGKCSVSGTGYFIPREKTPVSLCRENWVGPKPVWTL
jgi:hypothetical protein